MSAPSPSRPTTLRTVAGAVGCSVSAVSQALRGTGKLSPGLRADILRQAAALDYQRDGAAVLLRSRREPSTAPDRIPLALIERKSASPPLPEQILTQLDATFATAGYRLEHHAYTTRSQLSRLLTRLAYRGISGVFLGNLDADPLDPSLDWSRFTVIALWRFAHVYPFHTVRHDCFHPLRQLATYTLARGYQRVGIACLTHDSALPDDDERRAAALLMNPALGDIPPFWYHHDALAEGLGDWLTRWKPQAVIGFNAGTYHAILATGRRIPDDLAFACTLSNAEEAKRLGLCSQIVNSSDIADQVLAQFEDHARRHQRGRPSFASETLLNSHLQPGPSLPGRAGVSMRSV